MTPRSVTVDMTPAEARTIAKCVSLAAEVCDHLDGPEKETLNRLADRFYNGVTLAELEAQLGL